MRPDRSPTEEVIAQIGAWMARASDQLIHRAVSDYWGREDWAPEDLRGRATLETIGGWQTFLVDGVPLLQFGPVEQQPIDPKKLGWFLTANRPVKFLRPPPCARS